MIVIPEVIINILLIIFAVLLFEFIILSHEFGHFITAKLSGIRVNEFALGMGPKLIHFKRGETEYSLRAFPIGGFCAMEGEDESSDDPRAFGNKAVWKRILVVVAGAVMNILLGVVLMPLQKVTSALSGGIGSVWEKYTSIDEVMEQNEQLEAENAELRQQIVDYDRIKAENEAYKALARIQDSNTEASYISAFVIGRDPLDEFGGFTLDCGTVNGAAVNDAVISDKGYLIGMVVEADTTSCKVMTILHPSFSAAGVVSRTRENGIINGSTDYAGDGLCVLTNLERATETKMGDQVITTGLGGVFPPDLLVGTVQKVEPEVSGKSSIAVVRPGADPRTVKHVFVITDY